MGPLVVISDGQSDQSPRESWQSSEDFVSCALRCVASLCVTECRWSELTVTEQEAHPQKQNVLFMKDFQQSDWKESSEAGKGRATLWSLPCQGPIRGPAFCETRD